MRETSKPVDPEPPRLLRIHTEDWPVRDRIAMFRELFGRGRVGVEALPGEPLRIDATLVRFPDLAVLWGRRSPLTSRFADGNDRLMLNLGAPARATQFGRDIALEPGDAVALSGVDRSSVTTFRPARIATLEFPQGALLPLLDDPGRRCARRIPGNSPALALLRGYVRAAHANGWTGPSALRQLTVAHVYDLAAVAVGASREAEEIARGRGVQAARLAAIKRDLFANIADTGGVEDVAARHGVSARYVRMLFEGEGTSFTEFVRDERLKRARAMLLSPRFATRRIAEIAYEVGFNDLSYFNRSFRRRFGHAPGDARRISQ